MAHAGEHHQRKSLIKSLVFEHFEALVVLLSDLDRVFPVIHGYQNYDNGARNEGDHVVRLEVEHFATEQDRVHDDVEDHHPEPAPGFKQRREVGLEYAF